MATIDADESISALCPELERQRHLRSAFYQWKETA